MQPDCQLASRDVAILESQKFQDLEAGLMSQGRQAMCCNSRFHISCIVEGMRLASENVLLENPASRAISLPLPAWRRGASRCKRVEPCQGPQRHTYG
jgi:hypothetical protein